MNYRKLQNSRLTNQLSEYRYFKNKSLTESTNFTKNFKNEIIKMVDGKPEDLTDEEKKEVGSLDKTNDNKIIAAIEKLNLKFGKK